MVEMQRRGGGIKGEEEGSKARRRDQRRGGGIKGEEEGSKARRRDQR